jgi:uncharacterized peroxidase-related enzyme
MTDFTFYSLETAPADSKPLLQSIEKAYGFIPNLFAYMAESPQVLEAYLKLNELVSNTSLTPAQQQLALLTVSIENKCGFCEVAHRAMAKLKGADQKSIDAVRNQKPLENASDQALVTMVQTLVNKRGWLDDAEVDAFIAAGFSKQQVFELILIVSIKTLSNYTNHLTLPKPNEELLGML